MRHENTCRANDKNEVFQKLRTFGIKAYHVECDDPGYVGVRKDLPGPEVGSNVYEYAFRDSKNVRHDGTVRADSKEEAYEKLKMLAIKPFFVAEKGVPPPDKPKFDIVEAVKQVVAKKPLNVGERLKQLNDLKEQGLITEAEYAEKRAAILSEL